MPLPRLRVFVSSKMQELAAERSAMKTSLDALEVDAWIFEEDAGARSESIQKTFLGEVKNADLYIGVFWKEYGEYTVEEFEYARALGKDCLIYEKRDGIEGRRSKQLQDFLDRAGNVENGLTPRWFHTPEELGSFVKKDVAFWQADTIRSYKVSGAPKTFAVPPSVDDANRQDLLILQKKVKQFWIEGVLEYSIHHEALLALGKKAMTGAVEHPWETVMEVPGLSARSLASSIADVYENEDVGRFLLILGEPGSGKTTTLLELARDLLLRAEKDGNQPVPVIFNLSGWTDKKRPVNEWLADELKTKYQIPDKIGKAWLESRRLLIFLDGLDEVKSDAREECVRAINDFIIDSPPPGIVVCSRLTEYMALDTRLKLNAAVCLQPLTLEQVDEYLSKAGEELKALREAVKNDSVLQNLIQTPLMLSIMSLAYRNSTAEDLQQNSDATANEQRRRIFDVYIERMFERKGKSSQIYPKEKVKHWLSWLANQMQAQSQTVFLIEKLQPKWLTTWLQQLAYLFISRLLAGLCLGLVLLIPYKILFFLIYEMLPETVGDFFNSFFALILILIYFLIFGLTAFVVDAVMFKLIDRADKSTSKIIKRQSVVSFLLYNVVWFVLLLVLDMSSGVLTTIVLLSLVNWLIFKSSYFEEESIVDIRTVETLKWSWSAALKACLFYVPCVFILTLLSTQGIIKPSLISLFIGLPIGLLFGGLKSKIIEKKSLPNQGIKLTAQNAALGGGRGGVILGISGVLFAYYSNLLVDDFLKTVYIILILALIVGTLFSFTLGGYNVIKHFCLRLILSYRGNAPLNYPRFLDHGAKLIFLQRVGGGYIFIHRLLLEHFAAHFKDGKDVKT